MKLFLLDAYALIFRAYYALIRAPRFTTSGFNTSAIFGFVSTLEEVLRKEKPTHIAVCFDPQGPTFRHEAFDKYKGEREATPEDIRLSVPVIKEIVKAYNIPAIEVPGYEADDVIGTLATRAAAKGFTTYMMTPDKDFGQLVTDKIIQYKPAYRGGEFELRGPKEVCEKYGIENTGQVIDLLALMGDKVDNIPGCPGVGEKTAVRLIQQFGSVENMLLHSAEIKGALRKKVEENAEQIGFSKFLATIRTDVPVEIDADTLKCSKPDREALFAIFDRLEFRTLKERVARRLGQGETAYTATAEPTGVVQRSLFDTEEAPIAVAAANTPFESRTITEPAEVAELHAKLQKAKAVGIKMIATGEADMAASWSATAIALESGECVLLPCSAKGASDLIFDLLRNSDVVKCTYQAKRDYVLSARYAGGDEPLRNYYDVAVAHYLLQPEGKHTPHFVVPALLPDMRADMDDPCAEAFSALMLKQVLESKLKDAGLSRLFDEVEQPLSRVLAEMEITGVRIDVPSLNEAARDMQQRICVLEQEIYDLAGTTFNVGSPAQVGEVLFDNLDLQPKPKKTKTGNYSTAEDVLEKLAHDHPIVRKILKYRQLKKLLNTYLLALPQTINPTTGKVHTTYNQTVTATGRISSSDPNLQNIPVRDSEGRDIRKAFIPDDGHLFLSADYSQIELRLMADFSGDETMMEAFRHGEDIHAITASKIYHEPLQNVTPEQRRNAKTANFGIIYGISAFGLAQRLDIPRAEAKILIDGYFSTFPAVRKYMDEAIAKARTQGYVSTIHGRRRPLPDINSRNATVRNFAERNAINAPLQGSAADIIKIAMVRIAREMRLRNMKSKMIMQVHDELNFDVVPEELADLQQIVSEQMEGAYHGRVVLTASSGVASNWLDAH